MPGIETVTIINKSGKVVSTGKQLINIFKDAKAAYQEKKNELKAEHQARSRARNSDRLLRAREEAHEEISSATSSHRSHHSRHTHRHKDHEVGNSSRPPLTTRNHSSVAEGSVISSSSRRSRSSHRGHRRHRSPGSAYRSPFVSTELSHSCMERRHTDVPIQSEVSAAVFSTLPPPYTSQLSRAPLVRSQSHDQFDSDANIDMNLAYGRPPPDLYLDLIDPERKEKLKATMSRLDELLLEAECLQHSATAIIENLQSNPEAMAAVALTLAELSTLVTKLGPGVLAALKSGSPAIFALLASPQFLIAGGMALGATVVMLGGFKIIKKIQTANEEKEAGRMEAAMVYDGIEMGSIETWRRGIADVEVESLATSVDGELITPEAARQRKERIRQRRREERNHALPESLADESVADERSDLTIRSKNIPARPSSRVAPSEAGSKSSRRSAKTSLDVKDKERRKKAPSSTLSTLFNKNKDKAISKKDIRSSTLSLRPKSINLIEL